MRPDYLKIFLLRAVGNFLVLSAITGVILTFAPAIGAETKYRYDLWRGQTYYVISPEPGRGTSSNHPEKPNFLQNQPPPLPITPLDPNFDVIIPKIGANARVIENVDPGNYDIYIEALRHGVAHAKGTVLPGEVGNSVLFAHSVGNFWEVSRWNAVFYLLRELNSGDEVDIIRDGKRYIYTVYEKKIVDPSDIQYLYSQANFGKLTLQTCWPPGTTLKRLLVFARLSPG